jgi:rhomboid protease GluP
MSRRPTRAILCPSCGRLTNADAEECLVCGRRNPGRWTFLAPIDRWLRRGSFTDTVTVACVALYAISLLVDPRAALQPRGPFSVFSPSLEALDMLGAAGAIPWHYGRWWTLLTAIYLHGGLLHILFNVLWIRQLGPAVQELYGPSRLVVIFTVAGAAGFAASGIVWQTPFTVGASGAIFGLLGAMVAFGRRRGGTLGSVVLRQYGQWALILFIFGLIGSGVDNWAHAGGFIGGYACGFVLSLAERRAETPADRMLGAGALALTALGFGLSIWTALSR